MLKLPGRRILCFLPCAWLAGCAAVGKFDANPAHGVDLTGSWVLDRAASDDPQPLIDKLRPKPRPRPGGMSADGTGEDSGQTGPPQGGQQGGQQGGPGGRGRRGGSQLPPATIRNNDDPFTHTKVIDALKADVARSPSLTIRQHPEQISFDYGVSARTFTPGARSVVSADWGVADQSSGWKGKDYVIEIKPQTGVASLERYTLSSDGKHLTEQLRLGGNGFPVVQLKRVYDRTDTPLPRALPLND